MGFICGVGAGGGHLLRGRAEVAQQRVSEELVLEDAKNGARAQPLHLQLDPPFGCDGKALALELEGEVKVLAQTQLHPAIWTLRPIPLDSLSLRALPASAALTIQVPCATSNGTRLPPRRVA